MGTNNDLVEIKCPGSILKPNGKVYSCSAKLCMASPGSTIEIVCRRCKKKMLIVVNKDLNGNPNIKIRQSEDK